MPRRARSRSQIRPGLGRLAIAIPQRDEFLAALGTHADHYERAQLVLFEALGRARLHRVQVPRPSRLAGGSLMGALISWDLPGARGAQLVRNTAIT